MGFVLSRAPYGRARHVSLISSVFFLVSAFFCLSYSAFSVTINNVVSKAGMVWFHHILSQAVSDHFSTVKFLKGPHSVDTDSWQLFPVNARAVSRSFSTPQCKFESQASCCGTAGFADFMQILFCQISGNAARSSSRWDWEPTFARHCPVFSHGTCQIMVWF